ncbi:MAG TPA: hypothetical protein VGG10_10695 [Rhizomicrobium sp.]|jgi:hypothetical protein
MRFLSFYTPASPGMPSEDHRARMNKLAEDSFANGSLVATGAMMGDVTTVRFADGNFSVATAAPTSAAAGFAITEADSMEQATEFTKGFLEMAGAGECAVRALIGPPAKR